MRRGDPIVSRLHDETSSHTSPLCLHPPPPTPPIPSPCQTHIHYRNFFLAEQQDQLSAYEEELNLLSQQFSEERQKRDLVEQEVRTLKQQRSELRDEASALKEAVAQAEAHATQLTHSLQELEKQLETANANNASLQFLLTQQRLLAANTVGTPLLGMMQSPSTAPNAEMHRELQVWKDKCEAHAREAQALRESLEDTKSLLAQEQSSAAEALRALQQQSETLARSQNKDVIIENLQQQLLQTEREMDIQKANFDRELERVTAQTSAEIKQAQMHQETIRLRDESISSLAERLQALEADYEVLQRSFDAVSNEKASLAMELQEARTALHDAIRKDRLSASQVSDAEEALRREKQELADRCHRLALELVEKEKASIALQESARRAQTELSQSASDSRAERAVLEARVAALASAEAEMRRTNEALQSRLLGSEEACRTLTEAKQMASEELALLQQRVEQAEALCEKLRDENRNLLESSTSAMQASQVGIEDKLQALERERDALLSEAKAKSKVVDEAAAALAQHRRDRYKLLEDLGLSSSGAVSNDDVVLFVKGLQRKISDCEMQIQALQDALCEKEREAESDNTRRPSTADSSEALAMSAENLARVQAELADARSKYLVLLEDVGRTVGGPASEDAKMDPKDLIAKMRLVVAARNELAAQLQEQQERVQLLESQCKKHMEALDRLRRNDWSAVSVMNAIRKRDT